jgi:hypothetical protein
MHKRLFALMVSAFLVLSQGLLAQGMQAVEQHSEEWQVNPQVFAKLLYGDDLSRRSTGRGSSLKDRKKSVIEKMVGSYVEWSATYGVWPIWQNSAEGARKQIPDNTSLYIPIGTEDGGWIQINLIALGKLDVKKILWGIPPQCEVQLKMKLKSIDPRILRNGTLDIWVNGDELEIGPTVKRCDWPGFEQVMSWSPSYKAEIKMTSENPYPVKVGLRKDTRGADLIILPGETVTVMVDQGLYDFYFQFADEPANLFQGDSMQVDQDGANIKLQGKEAGDYSIRKIKE